MKKTIALLLVLATVFTMLVACNDGPEEVMGSENPYKNSDIVLKTDNFSYTRGEFSIAFNQYYTDFASDKETLDFYNIDTEVSLKDQIYDGEMTWFDNFAEISIEYMQSVLILCEGAKAAGVELSKDDIEQIEEAVDSYVRYANNYGYTEEEFFALNFGKGVDQDTLREYYKKEALALKYETQLVNSYEFSEKDLENAAEKDRNSFYTIDYLSFTFDEDEDKNARAEADKLAKVTTAEEFESYVNNYMTTTLEYTSDEISDVNIKSIHKYYDEYSEFSKKAFGVNAPVGLTHVKANEVDGQYTVYFLTKVPTLRTELTKNVRMLAISTASHETTTKALTYAEELLQEWKDGKATEESFIELIKEHSDIPAAASNDGMYENIGAESDYPDEFNKWLYNEETKKGSTLIFKDTGYYYIAYLCSDGEVKWKNDAKEILKNEKYSKDQEELSKKYTVEKFDEVINSLDK